MAKIEAGKPINLPAFKTLLFSLSLPHRFKESDINAEKSHKDFYLINAVNPNLLSALKALSEGAGNNRVSAANQNKSHDHKVLGSFLLVRKMTSHPFVVMFDSAGQYTGIEEFSEVCLIIENRQNFLNVNETLSFLKKQCDINSESEMDILFSAGNEITNSLHNSFLRQYKKIYVLFDLDLGGLTIFKSLRLSLPRTEVLFLVPEDIDSRLEKVVEIVSPDYLDKVIKLGMENDFVAPFASIIKKHRKVLEQENYLDGSQ